MSGEDNSRALIFDGVLALHPEWTYYGRALAVKDKRSAAPCVPIGSSGSCRVVDQAPSMPYRERTLPIAIASALFRRMVNK